MNFGIKVRDFAHILFGPKSICVRFLAFIPKRIGNAFFVLKPSD